MLQDAMLRGWDSNFSVNQFLFKKGSFLKDYITAGGFNAANWINSCAAKKNINAKWILVALQSEQGLISKKSVDEIKNYNKTINGEIVSVSPLDYCCGVGVFDNPTKEQMAKYFGFEKQIEACCETYDFWFKNFKAGAPKKLIGEPDYIPKNAIEFSTLMYTPHLSCLAGKERLWNEFFV